MPEQRPVLLTKSDFLLYCQAPRHLWAKINGEIEDQLSDFSQIMIEQGYAVENMAKEFLEGLIHSENPLDQFLWQQTFGDGPFQCRCDALVQRNASNQVDLFEIKSGTTLSKDYLYDIAFQALIIQTRHKINHLYLVYMNKDYLRSGDLDLSQLFMVEDVTDRVNDLFSDIDELRQNALKVFDTTNPEDLAACLSPKECPCPSVCHPDLPDCSIFDLPNLSPKKKKLLLSQGITAASDIPDSIELNEKQRMIVNGARTGKTQVKKAELRHELETLKYPIYFLDYETCISAVPLFLKYHPQQQVVFQYSLHRLDKIDGEPLHYEYLSIQNGDPSLSLLQHLASEIGNTGSVIVWNKTFEMTRNKEMAVLHPEFSAFLENLNQRIYDLGEIVSKGYYLHPGFKGSWSIKQVLPVMVPKLSYEGMPIHKGDEASMAWWKITFGQMSECEIDQICDCLRRYCGLDTMAMVEIYKRFLAIACTSKLE